MRRVALAVPVLFILACGGLSESAQEELGEEIAEKLLEAAAGEDVELDLDDEGSGTLRIGDQVVTTDRQQRTFSVTGADGDLEANFGENAAAPADWPLTPADSTVVASFSADAEDGHLETVVFAAPGTAQERTEELKGQLIALVGADGIEAEVSSTQGNSLQSKSHNGTTWHVQLGEEDGQLTIITARRTAPSE